jgi:hypothetical protein
VSGNRDEQSPTELSTSPLPGHLAALIRHFEDLRDDTHGGSFSRQDKETHFVRAVELMAPVARRALDETNTYLLLDSGLVAATGVQRDGEGGLRASWKLAWPEQRTAGVEPVTLLAHYGTGFHHPHLRGATLGDWPLNVFTTQDADDQLSVVRAIVAADLHNLVFQADYRIIPAITRSSPSSATRSS